MDLGVRARECQCQLRRSLGFSIFTSIKERIKPTRWCWEHFLPCRVVYGLHNNLGMLFRVMHNRFWNLINVCCCYYHQLTKSLLVERHSFISWLSCQEFLLTNELPEALFCSDPMSCHIKYRLGRFTVVQPHVLSDVSWYKMRITLHILLFHTD